MKDEGRILIRMKNTIKIDKTTPVKDTIKNKLHNKMSDINSYENRGWDQVSRNGKHICSLL